MSIQSLSLVGTGNDEIATQGMKNIFIGKGIMTEHALHILYTKKLYVL